MIYPNLVTVGSINDGATPIEVDVSGGDRGPLGAAESPAVEVTLTTAYTLANPMPAGYPTLPGLTGAQKAEFPGQVFTSGTTLMVLAQEADALIAAGAAVLA